MLFVRGLRRPSSGPGDVLALPGAAVNRPGEASYGRNAAAGADVSPDADCVLECSGVRVDEWPRHCPSSSPVEPDYLLPLMFRRRAHRDGDAVSASDPTQSGRRAGWGVCDEALHASDDTALVFRCGTFGRVLSTFGDLAPTRRPMYSYSAAATGDGESCCGVRWACRDRRVAPGGRPRCRCRVVRPAGRA